MNSKITLAIFFFIFIHFISPVCAKNINLATGCYFVVQNGGKNCATLKLINSKNVSLCLKIPAIFTLDNIAEVSLASFEFKGKEEYALHITLDDAGKNKFSMATAASIGKRIALVIDGVVAMAPVVQDKIDSGVLQLNTLHHSNEDLLKFHAYLKIKLGSH